jgi:hypothetical protein
MTLQESKVRLVEMEASIRVARGEQYLNDILARNGVDGSIDVVRVLLPRLLVVGQEYGKLGLAVGVAPGQSSSVTPPPQPTTPAAPPAVPTVEQLREQLNAPTTDPKEKHRLVEAIRAQIQKDNEPPPDATVDKLRAMLATEKDPKMKHRICSRIREIYGR